MTQERDDLLDRLSRTAIHGAEAVPGAPPAAAPEAQPAPGPTPSAAPAPGTPSTGAEAAAGVDPGTPQGANDTPEWAAQMREEIAGLAQHLPQPAQPRNAFLAETGLLPPEVQPTPQQRQAAPDPRLQARGQNPSAPQAPVPGTGQPAGVPGQQPPAEDDAALIERYIDERAQQAAQARIEPLLQQMHADRRRENAQALLEDYPELNEPATAQAVMTEARRWAEEIGDPRKAADPAFVELTLLASRTLASATPQNAGGPGAPQGQVQLERGGANGAATPGQQGAQPSLARQIVEADGPQSPARKFWGMDG